MFGEEGISLSLQGARLEDQDRQLLTLIVVQFSGQSTPLVISCFEQFRVSLLQHLVAHAEFLSLRFEVDIYLFLLGDVLQGHP